MGIQGAIRSLYLSISYRSVSPFDGKSRRPAELCSRRSFERSAECRWLKRCFRQTDVRLPILLVSDSAIHCHRRCAKIQPKLVPGEEFHFGRCMLLRGETKIFGKLIAVRSTFFYRCTPEKRQGQSFYT